jgi:citrate synthase
LIQPIKFISRYGVGGRSLRAMSEWIDAAQAAHILGVNRATLYAYVSRGLIAACSQPGTRRSQYRRTEVAQLALARARARKPKLIARASLDWGLPVMSSALTLIEDGHLYYRGQDVLQLAEHASLEAVAALLWGCPQDAAFGSAERPRRAFLRALAGLPTAQRLMAGFTWLQAQGEPNAQASAPACGRLLRLMVLAATGQAITGRPTHVALQQAWGCHGDAAEPLRQALVLCADHELNASSFAVRCVASTGASLGASVSAGLAALSGAHHGGMTQEVEGMWQALPERGMPERTLRALLTERLQRQADLPIRGDAISGAISGAISSGSVLPGFGHPLYPAGDPRAQRLLALVPRAHRHERLLHAVCELTGLRPSLDYALVALRRSLGLPEGSAFVLFAVGRTVGWLAHALEQGQSGSLIRPRAAYTGERPLGDGLAADASAVKRGRVIRAR